MNRLDLLLPFPPSVNSAWMNRSGAGRGRVPSAKLQQWGKEALSMLPTGIEPFIVPVSISIELGLPDKRGRDCSNHVKVIEDFLVQNGIIKDDSWQFVHDISVKWDFTGQHKLALVTIKAI